VHTVLEVLDGPAEPTAQGVGPDAAARVADRRLRLVTVTTFFPNSAEPNRTLFVKNLVFAMRGCCDLTVVAPVPLAPALRAVPRWYRRSQVRKVETVEGLEVVHPRFVVVPKVEALSGLGYFFGAVGMLRRLKREQGRFLVHVHCAYPDAVGVALAARLLGLPYVVTAHGSDINVYAQKATLRPQVRWALKHSRAVIAVSRALADRIRTLLGAAAPVVAHIPCAGYDPAVFRPRPRAAQFDSLGLKPHHRVVLFVGHLVPIKGLPHLVDAWSVLRRQGQLGPDTRLVLVGDGPQRDALQHRIAAAALTDDVLLAGALPQTQVADWVAAASVLCLPSLNEGTPNVVVEALASGVPVVASRVGGVPELVQEGVNGHLVEPGSATSLADALHRALEAHWDPQAVRATVAGMTWTSLAQRNCDLLASAWSTDPSPRPSHQEG